MPRFRKESLNGPCKIEIRKVHFPWIQVFKWKWIWLQDVHKLVIIPKTRMSESYAPMIIRHVRTFYRFDMSAFFVDYSTLWNPSRILKSKFDTLAGNHLEHPKIETKKWGNLMPWSFWFHFYYHWNPTWNCCNDFQRTVNWTYQAFTDCRPVLLVLAIVSLASGQCHAVLFI